MIVSLARSTHQILISNRRKSLQNWVRSKI